MRLPVALARLVPDLGEISGAERLRASAGACLGLFVTGLVSRLAVGPSESLPLLIAPMGASAVLLFAVPSSPLAQPWSILGGNVVSALVGVATARLVPDPVTAAAVAGALAIACMMVLRCLHPPSGAVALTAVLGGPAIHAAGFGFVFWPVGLNSVLLLAVALAFNNATGRRYPHGLPGKARPPVEATVSTVLRRHGEVVDLGPHDLATLLGEVEVELHRQPAAVNRCAELMRPECDALVASASLDDALDRMNATRRTCLPVVDAAGRCIGLAVQGSLVRHLRPTFVGRRAARLFQRSLRFDVAPASVAAAVTPLAFAAEPDGAIQPLIDAMLGAGIDYCPVLDGDGRLLGAVTQVDLLRWALSHRTMP